MKNRAWLFLILFFTFGARLFALGIFEETSDEIETQNNQWTLCISNFDSSSLPENKLNVADVIMKKLVESLSTINYRIRHDVENAYYEETDIARARSNAAKAIAAKRNERSLLIYRGDSGWRYRRNIQRIDAEIEKLYLELEEIDEYMPVINDRPVFVLTNDNMENKFPAAPVAGNEYKFCIDRKSDAVLIGSIVDFHERFIVSLKLYFIYTQSFIWEDTVIFSQEDIDIAVDEYTRYLIIALSGSEPAVLTVKAEPEDTLVLINRVFTGRGETSNLEYPPGIITVNASAPDHESITFETELFSGEHTEISINLKPFDYVNVDIDGTTEGNVYHGALFAGEAPLTLRLPLNQMEYIELLTPDNAKASTVFYTLGESEFNHSLILPDAVPQVKGMVDKARRNFYMSFGGTWIAGIAAWISYHAYNNSNAAVSANFAQTGLYDMNFYDKNKRLYYLSMGTLITAGATVLLDIFFLSRYINTSNKSNVPVIESGGD